VTSHKISASPPQDGSTLLATKHHEAYCQFYPGFLLNSKKNDIFLSKAKRVFRGDKMSHKKMQFQSLLLILHHYAALYLIIVPFAPCSTSAMNCASEL